MIAYRSASFAVLLLVLLFALPLVGTVAILGLRRSKSLRHLSGAVLLSGMTAGILTAFFGFASATVPLGPYESREGALGSLLRTIVLLLYVGFGLGSVLGSLIAVPASVVTRLRLRQRGLSPTPSGESPEVPPDEPHSDRQAG